jgi:hypothetical protein
VLALMAAGITYQCGVGVPGSGPYFQYCVPTGSEAGYTIVIVIVDPGVQPVRVKSNSPWGNVIAPAGGAGGLAGSPERGMKLLVAKEHVRPPPVKIAVMVPLPVAEGAMYDRTTAAGVTLAAADAGPGPRAFVAVTVQP